jgi:hypothetical protein
MPLCISCHCSNRLSPLLDPDAPRNSWALQAGQFWELLRDSQLLSRHMQLQQASQLLQAALQPPPPVAERRQQVRAMECGMSSTSLMRIHLLTPVSPAAAAVPLHSQTACIKHIMWAACLGQGHCCNSLCT